MKQAKNRVRTGRTRRAPDPADTPEDPAPEPAAGASAPDTPCICLHCGRGQTPRQGMCGLCGRPVNGS